MPEGNISIDIEPEGIHIMKKQKIENLFTNLEVYKDDTIDISTGNFEVDLTQLIPGSKLDENDYILAPNGKKYDFTGARVSAEIALDKIEISDDTEKGQLTGTIVSNIYEGDHYQVTIRTIDDEFFVLETPETWNDNDVVGIIVKKEDIKLRLKGDIGDYEI